jgi:Ca2+-binding RTX toxin-like protein
MLEGNVWGDGNILLGGAGSDTIEGRGTDDIIDGDRYMNVRISVRANGDGTGAEIASAPLMENIPTGTGWFGALAGKTIQQAVFAGLIDPGQLVIVREVVTPPTVAANCVAAVKVDCDTAVFSGPRADYDITFAPATAFSLAGITVNHARGTAADGIDTLRNIDQARFADQTVALPRANANPTSLLFAPRVVLGTPSAAQAVTVKNVGGGSLTVSAVAITGPNAASFSQTSNCTGTLLPAGCTVNVTVRPTVAGPLTATLNVFSNDLASPVTVALTGTGIANSLVTGVPVISDTTPTEGTAVTVDTSGIADANGLGTLNIQWLQSTTAVGTPTLAISGATTSTFIPTTTQTNRRLAVRVTFTDGIGFNETTTSAITIVVGDLFPGVGDDNSGIDTLAGTAGQDEYHGGASADSLTTGNEADLVSGGTGNDTISSGAGDDIVSGDAGDDNINAGAGDDTINFTGTSEGFDDITGAGGIDAIKALADNTNIGLQSIATVESIDANGHTGVTILGSTLSNSFNFTNVTLTGIVAIDGGGGNDTITGSAAADVIIGRAGADAINGGLSDDILEGGAGNDTFTLLTTGGNDVLRYLAGFGDDIVNGFDANATGGQDLIDLRGLGITSATFGSVTITNASIPGSTRTLITISGQGSILLINVGVAAITTADFILAP